MLTVERLEDRCTPTVAIGWRDFLRSLAPYYLGGYSNPPPFTPPTIASAADACAHLSADYDGLHALEGQIGALQTQRDGNGEVPPADPAEAIVLDVQIAGLQQQAAGLLADRHFVFQWLRDHPQPLPPPSPCGGHKP